MSNYYNLRNNDIKKIKILYRKDIKITQKLEN